MQKITFKKYKLSRKADIKNKIAFMKLRVSFFFEDVFLFFKNSPFLKTVSLALPVLVVGFFSYQSLEDKTLLKESNDFLAYNNSENNSEDILSIAGAENSLDASENIVQENDVLEEKNSDQKIALSSINLNNKVEEKGVENNTVIAANFQPSNQEENKGENNSTVSNTSEKPVYTEATNDSQVKSQESDVRGNQVMDEDAREAGAVEDISLKNNTSSESVFAQESVAIAKESLSSEIVVDIESVQENNLPVESAAADMQNEIDEENSLEKQMDALQELSEMRVLNSYSRAIDSEFEKTKKVSVR